MNAALRLPIDLIEPRHIQIHADLESWGRWSRDRRKRQECRSLERGYRAPNGNNEIGWQDNPPAPSPVNLPNGRMVEVDRAVLGLPQLHLAAFRMHYWHMREPVVTCRKVNIRFEGFAAFMTTGRDMVQNLLLRAA